MSFTRPPSGRSRSPRTPALAAAILAALLAACDSSTGPRPLDTPSAINTMAVRITGGPAAETTVPSLGGYQPIVGGQPRGVHLQTEAIQGLPLAIHIPGQPVKGTYAIGRWDPAVEGVRPDVMYVVRKPSIAFGDEAAVALGYYASLGGGTLVIDEVQLPDERGIYAAGYIRGRLRTRAAVEPRLVPPGESPAPDTITIEAAFYTALENWPDGGATLTVDEGTIGDLRAPALHGSGSVYFHGCIDQVPPLLVIGLAAFPPDVPDTVRLWLSTSLTAAGTGTIGAIDEATMADFFHWPSDFVAGRAGPIRLTSVSGTVTLDQYDRYFGDRWGRATGRLQVVLDTRDTSGVQPPGRATADVTFELPVGFHVELNCGSQSPAPSAAPTRSRQWPFLVSPE